jgi:succinate dehydrogenase hydrophobic anchor subunit
MTIQIFHIIWNRIIKHSNLCKSLLSSINIHNIQSKNKHLHLITAIYQSICLISLSPLLFFPLLLFLPFHIQIGLDEVIEDYIHNKWARSFCYLCIRIIILLVIKQSIIVFFI